MLVLRRIGIGFFIISLGLLSAYAKPAKPLPIIKLNTSDWPPYTNQTLANKGSMERLVSQVFRTAGFETKLQFMPWTQAVALEDDGLGFFPAYSCKGRHGLASKIVAYSQLGFVGRKTAIQSADAGIDLKHFNGQKVGIVSGYYHTRKFDWAIAQGKLQTLQFNSDKANLSAVATGQTDLAVIDPAVFAVLKKQNSNKFKGLELKRPLIASHIPLYVCFKDSVKGRRLLTLFDQALVQLQQRHHAKIH